MCESIVNDKLHDNEINIVELVNTYREILKDSNELVYMNYALEIDAYREKLKQGEI